MAIEKTKAKCEFCKKSFLAVNVFPHSCLRKSRWLAREDRQSEYAYLTYTTYLKYAFPTNRKKAFREFIDDQHFEYFYDFAGFLLREEAWDIDLFVRYLVKAKVPIKRWKSDAAYGEFLAARSLEETADQAVKRSVDAMTKWSGQAGHPWTEYFRRATTFKVVHDLTIGHLSVWALLTTDSGRALIQRLSREQLNLIEGAIDFELWMQKLDDQQDDVDLVTTVLREAGL